jgi:phage replication-related protein YjqB (UPF0714/DUF867 family)
VADRYRSFAALDAEQKRGIDYQIRLEDRGTAIVVVAPHGGRIEPGSSEIAMAIARNDYSFYAFEGLRSGRPHGDLHITSTRFDEPQARALIAAADTAIAIHGRVDGDSPRTIWAGGRAHGLRDAIASSLAAAGFHTTIEGRLAGRQAANICNRGVSGCGVQLEIPWSVRDNLRCDPTALERFSDAVRQACRG